MSRAQDQTRTEPRLYGVRDPGELVVHGRTFADWTLMQTTGTGSTLTEDTDGSALLTVPAGEKASIRADIDFIMSQTYGSVAFSVWCSDTSDNNTTVGIELDQTNDNLFLSYRYRYHKPSDRLLQGWTNESLLTNEMTHFNSGAFGQLYKARLTVDNTASAVAVSAKLGDIYYDRACYSKVVLCFDDGTDDHHNDDATGVAGYLESKGMRGTFFVFPNSIDVDANYLTTAQCQSMHNAGHDIANHTWVGDPMTNYTPAQQVESLINTKNWILDNVGAGAENYLAYPGGIHNAEIRASVAQAGMTYARTVKNYRYWNGLNGFFNWDQVYGEQFSVGMNLVSKISNLGLGRGGTYFLIIHRTDESVPSGVQVGWAEYTAAIDLLYSYKLSGKIQIMTVSEWMKEMSDAPSDVRETSAA